MIHFRLSSRNSSPYIINFLKDNPNIIDWNELSENPAPEAIQLLKENQDKIDWSNLSYNPGIWVDEYKEAQKEFVRGPLADELMSVVWHPSNAHKFADWGHTTDE